MAEQNVIAPGAFGVGTFARGDEVIPGIVVDDRVHDLRPHFGADVTVDALLTDWDASFERLAARAPQLRGGTRLADLRPLPPVGRPGQLLCVGANYRRHVQQIVFSTFRNNGDPRSDDELRAFAADETARRGGDDPFIFAGLPSALSGADDDVVLWAPGEQHDWELELGVVIGAPARDVPPERALEHVAGYVVSNDISVRDVMQRPGFPMTDFTASKNRPTYFPTGPYLLPRAFVPDYRRLRITLSVNGEVMQDETVADIIHGVEACVSYASRMTQLSPGDIVLTGSPAGNAGHHGNRWLRSGDVMEGSITGLGTQRNRCVAPPA